MELFYSSRKVMYEDVDAGVGTDGSGRLDDSGRVWLACYVIPCQPASGGQIHRSGVWALPWPRRRVVRFLCRQTIAVAEMLILQRSDDFVHAVL